MPCNLTGWGNFPSTHQRRNVSHHLTIKPSWTKGGIGRTIDITNHEQREWLLKAIQQVPSDQSLIPKERTYKQHLSHYQLQTKQIGISKCHGLRHAYAQRRYRELTTYFDHNNRGLISPIEGGKLYKAMTVYEKALGRKARKITSRELGHSRINITKIYLA